MKNGPALICYEIAAAMAISGYFNRVVLLFDFVILSIITVGLTVFGGD